jgi:hypothetical protein
MFRPFNFIKDGYIADIVSSTSVYHGFYNPSTAKLSGSALDTSKTQFMVAHETRDVSGNTTKMEWAIASDRLGKTAPTYDQIWDNRATLTYL